MKAVELFKFVHGDSTYLYTPSHESVVYNSETYVPSAIGRGPLESSTEMSKATMSLTLGPDDALVQELLVSGADSATSVTVFRQLDSTTYTWWKGRVQKVSMSETTATLDCESVFTSLKRTGCRALWQKTCRHALYSPACGADLDDFGVAGIVTAISGKVLTVAAASAHNDGYFRNGMIKGPDGTYRMITAHSGSSITLVRPLNSIVKAVAAGYGNSWGNYWGGAGVTLYPGCDKSMSICNGRFSNILNYGGFPWIPTDNCYDGSSIL